MPYFDTKEIFVGMKNLPFLEDIKFELNYMLHPKIKEKSGRGSVLDVINLKVNGEDVEFMAPHQFEDGSFYLDGKEVFTPLIVIEKYRITGEKDSKKERVDLNNSYIIPMYWLAVALSLERIAKEKNSPFIASAKLSSLASSGRPLSVKKYNLKDKNTKRINLILRKPFFFPLEKKNLLLRTSQLRMTRYLDRIVSNVKRYNSKSFNKKVGLIETPESKDIGLTRFLTYGAEYDAKKLKIIESKEEKAGYFTSSTLSVPFFNHSDSPRVMMGGKNMKQALIVDGREKPIITTSFEKQYTGINAVVGYMIYKGLNFEDAIVVSESFAEKMHVTTRDEIDFIFDSDEFITSIEDFKKIFEIREIGELLKPSQWLVKKNKNIKKIYDIEYQGKITEIKPPLPVIQNPKMRSKAKNEKKYTYKVTFVFEVYKPLKVGDKIMGRHGNKGVISKILPLSEMPFAMINGEKIPLDVILNPMGVISRMNIGQLIETSEALVVKYGLKKKTEYKTFEKVNMDETLKALKALGADDFGRFEVKDKNSSYKRVNVGIQYMVRLYHNASEKLAVRSEGKVSPISGIPIHGRKYHGGQRFGEMEVWAMLSHGATKTLNSLFEINEDKSMKLVEEAFKVLGYDFSFDSVEMKSHLKKLSSFPEEKIEISKLKNEIRKERKNASYVVIKNGNSEKKYYIPNSEIMEALNLKDVYVNWRGDENQIREKLEKRISKVLGGKSGILRAIVLGKRINYSGRAVIVPAPDLTIDEAYIPLKIAYEFTKKFLSLSDKKQFKLFLEGEDDGKKLAHKIEELFIYRKDSVLLNRQPTLHKHNILSFKPKVWTRDVIGLPLLVCKGYNADFDGDQMAIYYPQHQENFRDELEKMRPSRNLFDAGNGELILHVTQDIFLGAWLSGIKKKKDVKKLISQRVNDENFLKWLLEAQKDWLEKSTYSGVTLSYFEIEKDAGSYTILKSSKARGNESQFEQLNNKIEIDGEILERENNEVINSNFTKGLNLEEYILLTYRGINSMCDKKINVAAPGYLTRKLVETLYPIRIEENDVNTFSGLKVGKKGYDAEIVFDKKESFVKALNGRYTLDGVLLNEENLNIFWEKGYVEILSPITSSKVCRKCYGVDQSTKKMPNIGEYVGITSATVLGEKGTQKAMETFHTGKREINFTEIEKVLLGEKGKDEKELLQKIVDNVYNSEKDIGLSDLKLINFELLVFAIAKLNEGNKVIKWGKNLLLEPYKRGFLSALSFESPLKVMKKVSADLENIESIVFDEKSGKFFGRGF